MKITAGFVLKMVLYIIFLALFFGGAFWLGFNTEDNGFIQTFIFQYGYWGVFSLAILSGVNIIVPIPAISFLPLVLAAGLTFTATVLVITLGMTLGDGIGYMLGRFGQKVIKPNHRILRKLKRVQDKFYVAPIIILFFYAAFVPFPNELLVIPLGFLGYRAIHLVFPLLLGNAIFNILSAIGVTGLFNLFSV